MIVRRNSGKERAYTEAGVAVKRQTRWSRYVAHDLRHIGLQFRKRCKQSQQICCSNAEL